MGFEEIVRLQGGRGHAHPHVCRCHFRRQGAAHHHDAHDRLWPQGHLYPGVRHRQIHGGPDNAIDTNTQAQSFYVLYDPYKDNVGPDTGNNAAFNGRARLQQGTISNGQITVGSFFWNTPRNTNSTDKKAGWYVDLPRSGSAGGERQISSAALLGKEIVFTTVLPPSASTDACGGGSSYLYAANLASGLGSVTAFTNGAQSAPMILKLGGSGVQVSVSDTAGMRTKSEKMVLARSSTTGDDRLVISDTKTVNSTVGRLSWRQINNYRELKNKSWD